MNLVEYALKFRVTFYVMALAIMALGGSAIVSMPQDVLPNVDIPVVSVIWTYAGLAPDQFASRITTYSEFSLSNNVNGIKNIQSQTLYGVAVEKVYFQPDVSIDLAISQVVSAMNSVRQFMPPGVQPPIIVRYSASSVPVIQLSLSSKTESEQQLYDYAQYRMRQSLTQVPGITLPAPYGGKQRIIRVDLDLRALQADGLTPQDVTNAISAQNIVEPSGQAKIGSMQYLVGLNSAPAELGGLNDIPIKVVNGRPILLHDVANVRNGSAIQQNIVHADGLRSVLLTVLKNGNASTMSVVNAVKALLPSIRAAAPKDVVITPLFDQSTFVTSSIGDVLKEGAIAAGLTGLMILLFLGSWRSTLVVLISIPLSILTSLAVLWAIGETLNTMTLGGLALAVGILVDDATVAIENTYRLLEEGKSFRQSVVQGASEIAKPALISTLAICGAFISVLFLTGAARYIFVPQALAVVFAMLASYALSRTLVPIMVDVLVKGEGHGGHQQAPKRKTVFSRIHGLFETGFRRLHGGYVGLLRAVISHRLATLAAVGSVVLLAACIFPLIGTDYFPTIDSGEMLLHVRARAGLRIEDTETYFQKVEAAIRETVPASQLDLILDNIGLPATNYNLAFSDGSTVAVNDGEIYITLKPGHDPTAGFMRRLRPLLQARFPDGIFYFQPADMITQILNFGLSAPIDIQVTGRDAVGNRKVAGEMLTRLKQVRGAVDVHLQQILDAPELFFDMDRVRALELGLTAQQVSNNVNISLSSSYQVSPNFWSDPTTGIPYPVAVQTPEWRIDSMSVLENSPLLASRAGNGVTQPLNNVATVHRQAAQVVINHENTQPTLDVMANVQDRDLGSVARDIRRIADDLTSQLKPGNRIVVKGQISSMDEAFDRMGLGLAAALVFVYLLMAINYQSWGDPLVVLSGLPLAFCGICLALFATHTTFSIPSLMGAIMSVGIASANSILLVTFAREHRISTGCTAAEAAIAAGETRLRPVLMTAAAMFVGLIPMALDLGGGDEQNAALARAVMGGIAVGMCSTLLFVPFLYSVFRKGAASDPQDYL